LNLNYNTKSVDCEYDKPELQKGFKMSKRLEKCGFLIYYKNTDKKTAGGLVDEKGYLIFFSIDFYNFMCILI
jgi:hypothetical protein